MPGTHFAVVLSENEIAAIADAAVEDLAGRLAHRAFRPLTEFGDASYTIAEADALANLHALIHLRRAVERQADRAASAAAQAGAGYPQLGQACNISRQGARRRWPGLVSGRPAHDESSLHESSPHESVTHDLERRDSEPHESTSPALAPDRSHR
jgi:hypothetical protein